MNNPRPIRGDIPIMISRSGERKTLRMVARYADDSDFSGDADRLRQLVGVRDQASELLDGGIDALIFSSPYVHEPEAIELLGATLGPLCSNVPSGRSSVG